jgi:hypothetical protein
MQKFFTPKAFILLTLVFVFIAAASFAAFKETEVVCAEARQCLKTAPVQKSGEIIWEVVSRQFLSLISI